MSVVDERIVKMVFDNKDFAGKIASTIGSITQLNKATDSMAENTHGISEMGKAFQQAEIMSTQAGFHVRDVWLKVASILEYQIAGKIINVGKQIANAMTFEGISDGFREYELKMGSVQTILAGTGESLETVNKCLEELNKYSDQTIYSFADMTNNIGKFTNAGVKLEDAVAAIKGIANEAAISGANANEASRAMYNFSQALSAGYVKLIDWKSIENANMATLGFKETLLDVASAVGTVEKQTDGMYKVLTKNANGGEMKELVSGTKNFNDSLSQQWMTTEVLTKALKIYSTDVRSLSEEEKRAYEEELKTMGMTAEQIKKFEDLGSKATDAASEVKTFTMLIDTLKEAIGSGWAQTFEILIGDFEEAKKVWTAVSNVLGGVIDKQSQARNDLLKGWDEVGGRANILRSLKNTFDAIMNVVGPIGEAMKEMLPSVTVYKLMEFSRGLEKFSKKLVEISTDIAPQVKSVAKGVFAVLDIGLQIVSGFVKAVASLIPSTGGVAKTLLGAAASAGEFVARIDQVLKKAKVFETIFAVLASVIQLPFTYLRKYFGDFETIFNKIVTIAGKAFSLITSGISGILSLFNALFSSFSKSSQPVEKTGNILIKIFDDIAGGLDNIREKIDSTKSVFEGLKNIFSAIGTLLGTVFKQISESLTGVSFDEGGGILSITGLINSLLTGGILYKIFGAVKQFSQFGDILDGLGNALNNFGKKVETEALMNTAKAVAVLAGSLFIIAMIDSNKLAGATAAISTMIGVLTGAMALLMKAVNSFSTTDVKKTFKVFGKELFGTSAGKMLELSVTLSAVSKALVSMGAAVLMMSIGLKIVSSAAKDGNLWQSFAVISLMLAELTGVAIVLSKFGGEKAVKGLMGLTAALIIMAEALKIISKVVGDGNAWESLGILSIMLGELTGVVLLIQNFGKYKMTGMLSLISLALSLNLCVLALKTVSDALGNDGVKVWEALGIISIILAELTGVTILLSKFGGFAALGGVGAIMAAAALLIFVKSIKQISDALGKTDQHVWQALGVIAASLVVLAVGLAAMSTSLPGAAALLVASAGLILLGGALKIIGSISLVDIGKGLLAMGGSLAILAAGLTLMIVALPGALALIVASVGLTTLAGAMKLFGSMKLGEIVKSLLALFTALTGIVLIGSALSIFSPLLLVFSASLVVFGAAIAATGIGMTLFATGLQSLVAVIPLGTVAIKALGIALAELLPILVEGIANALGMLAKKIVEYGPTIHFALLVLVGIVLDVLAESAVKIGETIYEVLERILQIMVDHTPTIAQAGADLIIAFVEAISTEIPRIVDAAYKCSIALINGLADAIENNNGDLIDAVNHLMEAVVNAIIQWLVAFTPLGMLIPSEMKDGIVSGETNVFEELKNMIDNAIETLKEQFPEFTKAAEYLIQGFVEGITGVGAFKAVAAAADFGAQVIAGLTSKEGLDERSPSRKGVKAGYFLTEGLTVGIVENKDSAIEASKEFGGEVTDAMGGEIEEGSEGILDSVKNLITNIKDAASETDELTEAAGENATALRKQAAALDYAAESVDNINVSFRSAADAKRDLAKATDKSTESTEANTEATNANAHASGKGTKATKKQTDVMEYASGVVEAFTKNYGSLYSSLGETGPVDMATIAIKNLAETTYMASVKAKKAVDDTADVTVSIEDMIKNFTELKSKIYDSVKSMFEGDNFFQKFEVKTEKSMADMLEGMRSNVNAVANWSAKITELGTKGLDQGLLKQLAELGPKGFEYVNAFANATEDQIKEANSLFAQAATLPESTSNSVVASYANAGLMAMEGFQKGMSDLSGLVESGTNMGLTTLEALKTALDEHSPSKKTHQMGEFVTKGLANGIVETVDKAVYSTRVVCEAVIITVESMLDKSKFVDYGTNIGLGLAEGIASEAAINAVTSAATSLSAAADSATTKFNKIKSPARRYISHGLNIAKGLGNGMVEGTSYVESCALSLSTTVKDAMEKVKTIAEDDMEIHPVISPVLDLSGLKSKANRINGLIPARSIGLASSINIGANKLYNGNSGEVISAANAGSQINFTQNNYSPKALSRIDIYRQTKNQLSMLKTVTN